MAFYIASSEPGRSAPACILRFENLAEFQNVASEVLARADSMIYASDSIEDVCSKLHDHRVWLGTRFNRISLKDARKYRHACEQGGSHWYVWPR